MKHTLIFGIGSVINSAFGILLVPIYVRHLLPKEYGVLSLLTITLTVSSIFLKFGMNQAFFRHYYETDDPLKRRRIVGSTLLFLLVSSTLLTAVLYSLAPQVSNLIFAGDGSRAELVQMVFVIGFFEVITVVPDSILRARFESARYSILSIIAFLFQLFLISYLVILVDATVENVLLGRLAGAIFETLILFFAVRRELSLLFSFKELRSMLGFGAPLIFNQIAFILFLMVDRFFLEHFTSSREVGIYALASTLVSAVTVLATGPFTQVWSVMRFSVMKEEGAEEYYSRVLTYIVFVSMFLSLGVAAIAGDAVYLKVLKGYWPAATIIPLLSLSAVFDSAARVLNIGTTLQKRTIYAPLVLVVALGVNVALNFILIPRYSYVGATVATVISFIVFCALRYWSSNLFIKIHYEWGRVFTIILVGSLMIATFYLLDYARGETRT
ncbi:MAG TPA: oligosaccharide flippase family protein, partial [Blastocatellia bacterium]|nr:oligosaccharide flippase family protein [Blastocatellia bacterium]